LIEQIVYVAPRASGSHIGRLAPGVCDSRRLRTASAGACALQLITGVDDSTGKKAARYPSAELVGHAVGDPYRGYRFKILTRQGKNAPGGAYVYLIKGRLIGGFAMVAYPAQWGQSGVMSFIVNQNGKVYEKDLGKQSASLGAKMTSFDPGAGWKPVAP
jgi:hypothetical protein